MSKLEFKTELGKAEGVSEKPYLDTRGIPTIGVGFALLIEVNKRYVERSDFKKVTGITISENDKLILTRYTDYINDKEGKPNPGPDLIKKMELRFSVHDDKKTEFTDKDHSMANKVLDYTISVAEVAVKRKIGEKVFNDLSEGRKDALIERAFWAGNINSIADHVKKGDFAKAASVMNSIKTDSPGQKARAEKIAELLEFGELKHDPTVHRVQPKDTLGGIAQKYGVTVSEIKHLNQLKNENKLSLGVKLKLPERCHKQKTDAEKIYIPEENVRENKVVDDTNNAGSKGAYYFHHSLNNNPPSGGGNNFGWFNPFGNGPNVGGGGNGDNRGDDGGKGGFFANTYDFVKNGLNNFVSIFEKKASSLSHYMSDSFQPLFFQYTQKHNLIIEPEWLYSPSKEINRINAEAELRQEIHACLSNDYCMNSKQSIIDNVKSKFGLSIGASNILFGLELVADSAIRSFIPTVKGITAGGWIHPLRQEVRYATSHVSPLVLDLNGDGVKLVSIDNGVYFDIDNDNFAEKIGWVSKDDGQLARDVNKNGKIDDITELFGDDLISAYLKLSLLDSNGDMLIDEKDEEFDSLLVWQDKNSNGISEKGELKSLKELKIKNISIKNEPDNRIVEGNIISAKSTFTYEDGKSSEILDVHYQNDDMNSWFVGKEILPDKTKIDFRKVEIFRNEAIDEIEKKLTDSNINLQGDWIGDILKKKIRDFIDNFKVKNNQDRDKQLKKVSDLFQSKSKEFEETNQKIIDDILASASESFEKKKKDVGAMLIDAMQKEFEQEKNNINSRYISEFNDLKQKEIDAISKGNRKYKNKDEFEKALNDKAKEYGEKADQERNAAREKYQKRFNDDFNKILKEFLESGTKEFDVKIENNQKLFNIQIEKLRELIQNEFDVKNELDEKNLEGLNNELEKEAANIYNFVIKEIFPRIKDEKNFSQAENLYNKYIYYINMVNIKNDNDAVDGLKIDPEAIFLPLMRGYGKIESLHISISKNNQLKSLIRDFIKLDILKENNLNDKVTEIMLEWAGLSNIDKKSKKRSEDIEDFKVAFIEKITGQEFKQLGISEFIGQHASSAIQKSWDIAFARIARNLLAQGPLLSIFPKIQYSFKEDILILNSDFDEIIKKTEQFTSGEKPDCSFWIQLGSVLLGNLKELEITISDLNKKLSVLAGEEITLSEFPTDIRGDDKDNILHGTSGSDYMYGMGGNDKLYGKKSSDYIEGGDGNDEIYGDGGIDRLYGGNGNDIIFGGDNRDSIYGEDGNDTIYGEEGDDNIEGGAGSDIMDGGPGSNTLSYAASKEGVKVNLKTLQASGGDANGDKFKNFSNLGGSEFDDHFTGDDNDNSFNGESGNDVINGEGGNDELFGATGTDYLNGGDGDDVIACFEGEDHVNGGNGEDKVVYSHPYAITGVKVYLDKGFGEGGHAEKDTYKSVENVDGSRFNDVIVGDDKDNKLNGYGGSDKIFGNGGDDKIIALSNGNEIRGGDGNDKILVGFGSNYIDGGEGVDVLSYELARNSVKINLKKKITEVNLIYKDRFENIENVIGSDYDDLIIGDDNDNVIFGLAGNDHIEAGLGDDYIFADDGHDYIDGGAGIDSLDYTKEQTSGLKADLSKNLFEGATIALGDKVSNIENIVGTKFNDEIAGDDKNNILGGNDGDDVIFGREGNDLLIGGKGKNELYGEEGNDRFEIGEGFNKVYGGEGKNSVSYLTSDGSVEIDLEKAIGKKKGEETDVFEDIESAIGSKYSDKITGNSDRNILHGNDGDDYIDGKAGSDTISGGKGNNTLIGGEGDDIFLLEEGSNKVDGGSGFDTISYQSFNEDYYNKILENTRILKSNGSLISNTMVVNKYLKPFVKYSEGPEIKQKTGLTIDLNKKKIVKISKEEDVLENIEAVIATHFNDNIFGDNEDNTLDGLDGDDVIHAGGGNDNLIFGYGYSKLFGDEGNDRFFFRDSSGNYASIVIAGVADVDGGDGVDILDLVNYPDYVEVNMNKSEILYNTGKKYKLESVEHLILTGFNDIVSDSIKSDKIESGDGDDVIYVSDGNDYIDAAAGNDKMYFSGSGKKIVFGGAGSNEYIFLDSFSSKGEDSLIIVDFKLGPFGDKINLLNMKLDDSDKISVSSKSEIVKDESGNDRELNYAVIKILEGKELLLLGVDHNLINLDNILMPIPINN